MTDLSNAIISLIRTYVPIMVGAVVAWLDTRLGIVLSEDASAAAIVFVAGLASAVFYALVRALESRWPAFGVLLGSAKAPVYPQARSGM